MVRSLAHGFGYLGPEEPVDAELDEEILQDLEKLGVDAPALRQLSERIGDRERERLRVHRLRHAFHDTLVMHREAVTEAFVALDYNFKRSDEVRLNLLRQAQAVLLLFDGFEKHLVEAVDTVSRQTQSLSVSVSSLEAKVQKVDQLLFDSEERALAMREAVRRAGAEVRGSGPAAQRLAFYGALFGAAIGGGLAFAVLFSAWVLLG